MALQALITDFVIDGPLRFPHLGEMRTHDEIREELIRQIAEGKLRQIDVAAKLCIAPARVSEMRKRTRRVQPEEMPVLAEMLGLVELSPTAPRHIESEDRVPLLGKVAQGVWLEQSPPNLDPEEMEYVSYDRTKGDPSANDLFAVDPEGTSMNLAFPDPRTRLICRRVPFTDTKLEPGKYVIVERTAHDLHELTCKRVEIDDDGVYWLHCESTDPRWKNEKWRMGRPSENHHTDDQISIVATVIRAVIDFER